MTYNCDGCGASINSPGYCSSCNEKLIEGVYEEETQEQVKEKIDENGDLQEGDNDEQ
jgi:hypothetical protein